MKLVKFLDSWDGGLLGVAYGGGEPFTHPDIVEIVKRTWNETNLDVSLTTNGFAVSPDTLAAIEGYVGEVRVSIYDPSNCRLLEKFLNRRFDIGVNILLVNDGISNIENTVETCVEMGVRDFLINSLRPAGRADKCKDMEPTMDDYLQLAKLVEKFRNKAKFKVSTRTAETLQKYTKLQFIPFTNQARGRIIAITADRKVKPSSMSTEAYPFNEPEETAAIYRNRIAMQF
jgi:MoaA/NifB/PqqE/SkfB family radical SAM enzyme